MFSGSNYENLQFWGVLYNFFLYVFVCANMGRLYIDANIYKIDFDFTISGVFMHKMSHYMALHVLLYVVL